MIGPSNYEKALEDLTREAGELETRIRVSEAELARLRPILSGLRDLVTDARRSPPLIGTDTTSPPATPPVFELASPENGADHRRGDTTKIVFSVIEQRPGLTQTAVFDAVVDQLTSPAKNKRKLVGNVVRGLVHAKRVYRDHVGGLWPVVQG